MPRPASVARPPIDKGWAWIVVLAIFFERFFVVGVTRSSGLFLLRLVERYHVTTTYAGTALTLALAIFAVGAPVATVVGESLTARCLFLMGGVFAVSVMTVSGLVSHLPTIVITMGLAIGVVNSCSYGNGMVMIGKYFREKRQLATNIALLGASIGQLVLPPVLEFLVVTYGLSGAMLLSGGLYFQCAVAGALLRPIDVPSPAPQGTKEEGQGCDNGHADEKDDDKFTPDDGRGTGAFGRRPKYEGVRFYKKLKSEHSFQNSPKAKSPAGPQEFPFPCSNELEDSSPSADNQIQDSFTIPEITIQTDKDEVFLLPRTDDWHDVLYGGNRVDSRLTVESSRRKSEDISGKTSLKNGRRQSFAGPADHDIFGSTASNLSASDADSCMSDAYDSDTDKSPDAGNDERRRRRSSNIRVLKKQLAPVPKSSPRWTSFFRLVFDFSVLKNCVTVLFIFITFLFYFVWHNFVFLLPGIVLEKGVIGYERPILISMIGLGDMAARVVIATGSMYSCGSSVGTIQRYRLKAIAAFLGSVNIILFIPASSFSQLVMYSFLHGLFGGAFESMVPGVMIDFVGITKMAQTLGVVLLFQGVGGAVGQAVLGCLRDITGSFLVVCAVCSGSLLVSCCLLLLFPLLRGKD